MPIHIRANKGDVAPHVLLPGDPDRAQYIAERFLEAPQRYTDYRRMDGYTGTYRGTRVSVQSTGMGCPSAAIMIEELVTLGAQNLLRIGTCGTIRDGIALGDLIVVTGACALNSSTTALVGVEGYAPVANYELVAAADVAARSRGIRRHMGIVATMDLFYDPREELVEKLGKYGVLALEMEASVVLTIGARPGLRGGCLLTVSDLIASLTRATPEAIRAGVDEMVEVALDSLLALDDA